ncbi:MAG TPA: DUF2061 domain-containing protein [Orrella sp.]
MTRFIRSNAFTLKKTASYYVTHMTVAAAVAYAVTGSWVAAVTLSLLEPTVQTIVYFFHERIWLRYERRQTHTNKPVKQPV